MGTGEQQRLSSRFNIETVTHKHMPLTTRLRGLFRAAREKF